MAIYQTCRTNPTQRGGVISPRNPMASNKYPRTTVDGETTWYSRKGTQGRAPLPEELRKVKFSARVSKWTKKHVQEEAQKHGMKPSAYADIALSHFNMDNVGQDLVKS